LSTLAGNDSWKENLPCFVLKRAATEAERLGIIHYDGNKWTPSRDTSCFSGRKLKSVQERAVQQLVHSRLGIPSNFNTKVVELMSDRIKRWKAPGVSTTSDCHRALSIARDVGKNLPARFVFGFWQSVFYGWLTDTRFRHQGQVEIRSCIFSCGEPDAKDDFYHYAVCSKVWAAFYRLGLHRSSSVVQTGFRWLLLFEGDANLSIRMAFLTSVMVAVHKLRSPHSHVHSSLREKYIRDTFKEQVCSCPLLKSTFNELWARDVFAL